MPFADFIDALRRRPTRLHRTIELSDPEAPAAHLADGYFQVRVSDMYLTDARRWQRDIVPAAFVLADYRYAGEQVRQPFFVSNRLLTGLPPGIDATTLRAHLRDTLVLGPAPYAGGDVALFIGLFQSTIADHRATLFSILENLFGSLPVGALDNYLKLADKLIADVARALGDGDIECRIAERAVLNGDSGLPRQRYRAYLQTRDGTPDVEGLEIHEQTLWRRRNGHAAPVDDVDYCLLRIEQVASRNDFSGMDFDRTWADARIKMLEDKQEEADALMLACARQVLLSPDLTEQHKSALIRFYKARLLAVGELLAPASAPSRGAAGATRAAAGLSALGPMQQRASHAGFRSRVLHQQIEQIGALAGEMVRTAQAEPASDAAIAAYLARQPGNAQPPPAVVLEALAIGTVG